MNCRDRCATDAYDSVIRRLEGVENKNLDQDNAIDAMGKTIPDFYEVDTLKIDVDALQNEKLDNTYMDEDIHFGPVTITKDGTAVIASFEAVNPTTGESTPMSILLPGATTTDAGVMDASSVSWIADAEERISALEGLSDVKAVADITGAPTQAELTTGWVAVADKQPETGDILQDINNSKLWVFVGTDWVLYGTIVTVPLATTSTIGGVRDTSLTAPGNRWYAHVEADGRLTLIGGDSLSTLIDTTIPAVQSGVSNSVKKTGNEDIAGVKTFTSGIDQKTTLSIEDAVYKQKSITRLYDVNDLMLFDQLIIKWTDSKSTVLSTMIANTDANGEYFTIGHRGVVYPDKSYKEYMITPDGSWITYRHMNADGTGYSIAQMRASPGATDAINKGYLDGRLTSKQDKLIFDDAPVSGSSNPVKSGGVYSQVNARIPKTDMGIANGVATLGADGKVPVSQLPEVGTPFFSWFSNDMGVDQPISGVFTYVRTGLKYGILTISCHVNVNTGSTDFAFTSTAKINNDSPIQFKHTPGYRGYWSGVTISNDTGYVVGFNSDNTISLARVSNSLYLDIQISTFSNKEIYMQFPVEEV